MANKSVGVREFSAADLNLAEFIQKGEKKNALTFVTQCKQTRKVLNELWDENQILKRGKEHETN